MKALIQIRSDAENVMSESIAAATRAMKEGKPSDPVTTITFSSPGQLFSVISPKRWELIESLQKVGPTSIRGLARVLERDIKRVHEDVTTLEEWSIIERCEDGKIFVPYEIIHADFNLQAAA